MDVTRWAFLVMSVSYAAARAAILVVAVLLFPLDIKTVLLVMLTANILFGVLGMFWCGGGSPFRAALIEYLSYCFALPLGFIGLLGAAVPMLERQSV